LNVERKELEPDRLKRIEHIWVKLDLDKQNEQGNYSFKKFYQNHGFDLESELEKYPIRELANEKEKHMLISSLRRGNIQHITLETGEAVFIEVDPENKKIQFYDMDFKELSILL